MAKQTTTTNTTTNGPNAGAAPAPTAEERGAAVTPQEVPALADRQARPDEQAQDAGRCSYDASQECTCAGRTTKCPALPLHVNPDDDFKPASPENERFNRALSEAKERRARGLDDRREAMATAGNRDDVPTERTTRGPRWTEE